MQHYLYANKMSIKHTQSNFFSTNGQKDNTTVRNPYVCLRLSI